MSPSLWPTDFAAVTWASERRVDRKKLIHGHLIRSVRAFGGRRIRPRQPDGVQAPTLAARREVVDAALDPGGTGLNPNARETCRRDFKPLAGASQAGGAKHFHLESLYGPTFFALENKRVPAPA